MEKEVRQLAYSLFEELIEKKGKGLNITNIQIQREEKSYDVWYKYKGDYSYVQLFFNELINDNPDRVAEWRKKIAEIEKEELRSAKGFIQFLGREGVYDAFKANLEESVIAPLPMPVRESIEVTDTESYLSWLESKGSLDDVFNKIFDLKESPQGESFWRDIEKKWK